MKIVFVSNYYNHHQHAVSQVLNRLCPGEYAFISTSDMRQDRKKLGYGNWEIPDYVHTAHTSDADARACEALIDAADVIITGSAPERMIRPAIAAGKLVFFYRERPLKQRTISLRQRLHFLKTRLTYGAGKNVYLLCAGGFTAGDYLKRGCFAGRTYRWGYFPETKYYDIDALRSGKNRNSMLWVGRFLDWKHPEHALETAKRLREADCDFTLDFIGTGPMEQQMKEWIAAWGLGNCVRLLGPMKPEVVRAHMERAEIFLFTSDQQEGWGAVLNEAMNSGCAVVASHVIGAAPCLIDNEKNGLVYWAEDVDMLCGRVRSLLEDPVKRAALGRSAYETITGLWNAETAAVRLYHLAERILAGEKAPVLYESGPVSSAPILDENWLSAENPDKEVY